MLAFEVVKRSLGLVLALTLTVTLVACSSTRGSPATSCAVAGSGAWQPIADGAPPFPALTVPTANGVAIFGTTDNAAYDVCTNSWKSSADRPTFATTSSYLVEGTQIVFANYAGEVVNAEGGDVFDAASASWTRLAVPSHDRLLDAGGRLFLWGVGDTTSGASGVTNGVAIVDVATGESHAATSAGAPSRRVHPALAWTGSRALVWGGGSQYLDGLGQCRGCTYFDDGAAYDPAKDAWTPINASGAPASMFHPKMVWTGRVALLWDQGFGGNAPTPLYAYDPAADRWSTLAPIPMAGNLDDAIWVGGRLVMADALGLVIPSKGGTIGAEYDVDHDTWTQIAAGPPEIGCGKPNRYVEQDRVVLLAGPCDASAGVTLAAYSPAANAWKTVHLPSPPIGVDLPASAPPATFTGDLIWTGKQIVAWGGTYALEPEMGCGASRAGFPCDPTEPPTTSTNKAWILEPDL